MNSQQEEQLLKRNADLQQELAAKNRELEIEAALEKVRARAMAMKRSGDLLGICEILFTELCALGFNEVRNAMVNIYNDTKETLLNYDFSPDGGAKLITVSYNGSSVMETFIQQTKRSSDAFTEMIIAGAELENWKTIREKNGEQTSEKLKNASTLYYYYFSFGTGVMGISSFLPVIKEQLRILERFKNIFTLSYQRYTDIAKAEAQAKEAQIEAALERVRSRSMAMQKSEELKEVIQLIFDQLYGLDFNIDSASFAVELNETDDLRIWVAAPGLKYATRINLPYIDNPVFNRIVEAKRNGVKFLNLIIGKEDKNKFFDHYFKYVPGIPEERKNYVYLSSGWASSNVLLENLALNIQNYSGIPYSEKENNTLARFGKVFEQTYTRFLDLKKAEASTKEAVKQASLDRVRGEIASMRTTGDLERITPLVWKELTVLNVPFIRCGVFIMDEKEEMVQTYLSTPEGKALAVFQLPFHSEGIIQDVLIHWRNKQPFTRHWNAATFSEWTKSLVDHGAIKSDERYSTDKPPENLHLHFLPFLQGVLYVGNVELFSEEDMKLVQSLADVFSAAYARYEDFNKLETAKQQIEKTLSDLKAAQAQLIQTEKMASLGELTAGIAHEIQNPLNFVNNFSETNTELIDELMQKVQAGNNKELLQLADSIKDNELKIAYHGKRADAIVKGMLQHSRKSTGQKEPTDINALVDEYLRLAYHGFRAKGNIFNSAIETSFDESIGSISIIPQDIGRVLLNLFNNAFYAVNEKKKLKLSESFEPVVVVSTYKSNSSIQIHVKDNGLGIPQKHIDKIFQPFFTTKPTGQGTGLGLSLSYDIIKAHNGELKVASTEGKGSEFIIELPS